MNKISWLISKYIWQSILPYFIFTWILLSVILFVQQAGRYSDIFFSANIPASLIWQLTFALAPNVIAFTCPMAVLIGVIIGLSKMQGDSELIAIRAAGVGNSQITIPIVVLGLLLSFFAFYINLNGIPFAAQIVRKVALQTAIYKLESPIEPGVFNTEINGYTIYVKDGDFENGEWKNVFIYNEDKENNQTRLITSKNGRIDSNSELSELVLENAVITTVSKSSSGSKSISENIGQVRLAIKTKRAELVEKISKAEQTPDELGLQELIQYSISKQGKEKIEAQILWQRRLLLSITPLIFALLGTGLVLRFNRGGRGFGIFLALVSLVGYYLLALFGEQLSRTETFSTFGGGLLPLLVSIVVIGWLFVANRVLCKSSFSVFRNYFSISAILNNEKLKNFYKTNSTSFFSRFSNGLMDFTIVISLIRFLLLTIGFLGAIYFIFTAFELWKFAGSIPNGIQILTKYLMYLIPFIYIQLVPSALMIACLATYVIKSRQNEIVTWIAAGQSVYRLLLPCFVFMIFVGIVNFQIQERILPRTNQIQDDLRNQLRNRGVLQAKNGKYWVANDNRIYSFEIKSENLNAVQKVENLTVYEFSQENSKLQTIYQATEAIWEKNKILLIGENEKIDLVENNIAKENLKNRELNEESNPFMELYKKPNHLSISDLKTQIENAESKVEKRNYQTALEKKYSTLILPFIITLFTAPFALSLSRKGKVITVGYAVGLWLLFMGITNFFEQMGLNGFISPSIAVWSPLFLFTMLGVYLLSKVKT